LLAAVLEGAAGRSGGTLSPAIVQKLLSPQARTTWAFGPTGSALGLFVDEREGVRRFYAAGDNPGYLVLILGYPDRGEGIVVLANQSANGPAFSIDLLQRIRFYSEWSAVPYWGR
jgi:hypothetical protein